MAANIRNEAVEWAKQSTAGQQDSADGSRLLDAYAVNPAAFPTTPRQAKVPVVIQQTPGKKDYRDCGAEPVNAVRFVENAQDGDHLLILCGRSADRLVLSGSNVGQSARATDYAPGNSVPSLPIRVTSDGNRALWVLDNTAWYWGLSDAAPILLPVGSNPDEWPDKDWVDAKWLDGYLILFARDGTFYHARDPNSIVWEADFAEAEVKPDGITGAAILNRRIYIFGEKTIECWFNSGGADFLFARDNSFTPEVGCRAVHTIQQNEDTVFFLGSDGVVYALRYGSVRRISHEAVEKDVLANHATANAFTYTEQGHKFYSITMTEKNLSGFILGSSSYGAGRTLRGMSADEERIYVLSVSDAPAVTEVVDNAGTFRVQDVSIPALIQGKGFWSDVAPYNITQTSAIGDDGESYAVSDVVLGAAIENTVYGANGAQLLDTVSDSNGEWALSGNKLGVKEGLTKWTSANNVPTAIGTPAVPAGEWTAFRGDRENYALIGPGTDPGHWTISLYWNGIQIAFYSDYPGINPDAAIAGPHGGYEYDKGVAVPGYTDRYEVRRRTPGTPAQGVLDTDRYPALDVSLIAGKTEANLRRIAVTAPLGSEIFFYQANGANIAPSQETAAAAWNKHLITVPQNAVTAGINVPTGQTASVQFVVQTSADSYALVSLQPNDEFLVTAGDNTDAGDPQQALLPRAVFFSGTPSDLQHIETISEAAAAGWNNHRLQSPEGATYMGITVPDGQAATLKRILYNEIYDHFDLVSVTPGSDYLIYGDFEDDDPHPDNTNEGNGYIRFYSRSPSSGGQPTGDSLKPNRNIASNSNDPYRLTVPPNASQMAITLPSGKTISKIRKVLPNTYRIERYSFSGESQGNDTINATEATALNTTELSAFHSGGLAILQQDIDGSNPRIRRRLGQMSRPLGDLPDLGTGTAIKDFAYIGDNAVVVGYSNSAGDRSRIDLLVYDNGNNPTRHASAEFSGLLALAYRLGQPNTIFALRAAGTDIKIKRYSVVLQDSMESITESSAQESTLTMQQGANPSGNYQSLIVIETSSGDESLMTLKDNGRVDLWTADANGNYAIAQGADNKKNWTYDATTGFWHERSETTLLVCERSEGRNLVGGTENGMVSEYSIEHQNGDSVHEVVCPSIHANQQKLKFNRLQVQTGIFVEDEAHFEQNYPNFYAELESSDNGGHIWQKHGKVRIQQQMVWRALGQTQFGRNFRLLWKADRRVDILGAYISAQKGTN